MQRAGYKPFTPEATYFLQAVTLNKLLVINERLNNIERAQQNSVTTAAATATTKQLQDPVISSQSDAEDIITNLDKASENTLIEILSCMGGCDIGDITRRVMKRFISTEILALYNRTGTDGKKAFIGPLENIVKHSVKLACSKQNFTYNQLSVETAIKSTLKVAFNKSTSLNKHTPLRPLRRDSSSSSNSNCKRRKLVIDDSDAD